jgi:dephospho-CoA kinase
VDEVWVTYAPEAEVVARLKRSKGLSEREVRKRIGAQLPPGERAKLGQVVIDNSGTPEALRSTVEGIWKERLEKKDG